jgi:hypothetical protein
VRGFDSSIQLHRGACTKAGERVSKTRWVGSIPSASANVSLVRCGRTHRLEPCRWDRQGQPSVTETQLLNPKPVSIPVTSNVNTGSNMKAFVIAVLIFLVLELVGKVYWLWSGKIPKRTSEELLVDVLFLASFIAWAALLLFNN